MAWSSLTKQIKVSPTPSQKVKVLCSTTGRFSSSCIETFSRMFWIQIKFWFRILTLVNSRLNIKIAWSSNMMMINISLESFWFSTLLQTNKQTTCCLSSCFYNRRHSCTNLARNSIHSASISPNVIVTQFKPDSWTLVSLNLIVTSQYSLVFLP